MRYKSLIITGLVLFCIIPFASFSQSFQIKGVVKDLNDSVVYGTTVRLIDTKANLLQGTTTGNQGKFKFEKLKKGNYSLIVSSLGFLPDTTIIKSLSKNLDVGTIYLQPADVELDEITVSVKSVFNKDGIKYIIPPDNIVESSTNGIMLLDKMNLHKLHIDPLANTVSVSGGGEVQFRINGRKVSAKEIGALPPDDIIRIEYHDKPEARYNYAAVVLDYIVKHRQSGGYIYSEIWTGLLNHFGENGIWTKFNYKKSEFSASYYIAYRDWNKLWRENQETFNLQNQTIIREEKGQPADFEYYNHRIRLNYNYQDTSNLFNVSLKTRFNNFVHKDWRSDLYSNVTTAPTAMFDSSQNKTLYPSLSIYYQHSLNKKELLIFDLYGMDNSTLFKRYYREQQNGNSLTDLYSKVEEKQYVGGLNFLYENKMKFGTLNIGFQEKTTLTKDTYNNTYNSSSSVNTSSLDWHNLYLYSQLGKQINKFYFRAGVGVNANIQKINDKSNNRISFRPSLLVIYNPNKDWKFTYSGSGYPTMPKLFELSDYSQTIDSLQISKGNPKLKNQISYYNATSVEFNKKTFGISYYFNHTFIDAPIMESTYLDKNVVVRTIENHKDFQKFNTELDFNVKFFSNILSIWGYYGLNYYISNGNSYNHKKTIPYYGFNIRISYKKFTLKWFLNQNTYDGFWGETLTRDESGHVVSLSYNTSNFYIGVDCFNMFSTKHTASKENYNQIAPYVRYEYLDEVKNLLRLKITYTFSYGKNYNAQRRRQNSINTESGILKGEK